MLEPLSPRLLLQEPAIVKRKTWSPDSQNWPVLAPSTNPLSIGISIQRKPLVDEEWTRRRTEAVRGCMGARRRRIRDSFVEFWFLSSYSNQYLMNFWTFYLSCFFLRLGPLPKIALTAYLVRRTYFFRLSLRKGARLCITHATRLKGLHIL
jgi:hypothetical protein